MRHWTVVMLIGWGSIWAVANRAAASEKPTFVLSTADQRSEIRFHLTTQLRLDVDSVRDPGDSFGELEHDFFWRRIRPVVRASLFEDQLSLLIHLNLVPGAVELIDLYFNLAAHPSANLRLGQMKVPFTRYRLGSFRDLPVVDWSYPTRYFGAERQLGLMLHNGQERPPEVEYELGLYGGQNIRASNGVGAALVYGEPVANPSYLTEPGSRESLHPELVAHLAYNSPGMNVRTPADREGGPLRWSAGMSMAWDLRPTPARDLAARLAPEIQVKAYGLALSGVTYLGLAERTAAADQSLTSAMWGLLAQSSYRVTETFSVALRYAMVRMTSSLNRDAIRWAERRVAGGGDPAQYSEVGDRRAQDEATVGINWYAMGSTLEWQIDAGVRVDERRVGNGYQLVARTQLQLAF